MKDFFKRYHKHKVLSNLWILSLSAVLAISINSFVLTGNTSDALKANILEATTNSTSSVDLIGSYNENILSFMNSREMQNVTEFSFSLAYNPEALEVLEAQSNIDGVNITELKNEDGFVTYIMNFAEKINIPAEINILEVQTNTIQETTNHINIIGANFTDDAWEKYILSTEWFMF